MNEEEFKRITYDRAYAAKSAETFVRILNDSELRKKYQKFLESLDNETKKPKITDFVIRMADNGYLDFKDSKRQQTLRNLLLSDATEEEIEEGIKDLINHENIENNEETVGISESEYDAEIAQRNDPEIRERNLRNKEKARVARMYLRSYTSKEKTPFIAKITSKENVDSLTDKEAILLYEIIKKSKISDVDQNVKDYLNGKKEYTIDFDEKRETESKELTEEANKIKASALKIRKAIQDVVDSIAHEEIDDTTNEILTDISKETGELSQEAVNLLNRFKKFETKYNDGRFTCTAKEIKAELEEIKKEIQILKEKQIREYNSYVTTYNEMLKELKENNPDNEEIQKLQEMPLIIYKKNVPYHANYFKKLKYQDLINKIKKLQEYGITPKVKKENIGQEGGTNPQGTSSDGLTAEINNESEHNKLSNEIDKAIEIANFVDMCVDHLYTNATLEDKELFDREKNNLINTYNSLKLRVEQAKENNKINDVEYQNLIKKLAELENKIENIKNIEVTKSFNWTCIDNSINSIEEAINNMNIALDKTDTIKGKDSRIKFEKEFEKIRKSIATLRTTLEKETNEEERKKIEERLNIAETKLGELENKYRQKCPLAVRTYKKAEKFYKKNKKIILIALGLATIAMIHATTGPVLIPLIMKGNLGMMVNLPKGSLGKSVLKGINKVLGKTINASVINNYWYLANGSQLYVPCSITFLKGLAYSITGAAGVATISTGIIKGAVSCINNLKSKWNNKFGANSFDKNDPLKEEPTTKENEVIALPPATKENTQKITEDSSKQKVIDAFKASGYSKEEYIEKFPEAEQYLADVEEEKQSKGRSH